MFNQNDNADNSSNAQELAEPMPERGETREEPLSEFLVQQVEMALSPLLPHLTARQIELVRSTLHASIDFDPVSRRLVANAVRTADRSSR